jgi:hypothetical protein
MLVLFASMTVYGQSLEDVARQSREKKAAATTPPKVITDADLAKDEPGTEDPGTPSKVHAASPGKAAIKNAASTSTPDSQAAEQWRRQILAQKRSVETLEKRLARYQASLSSVDASAIARGEILSRNQALERDRLAQVQEQLDEQRSKLLELQEEARRAGMHTQVYDP